ncbi:PIG-F family protein [Aspergillus brunneoviolaceus CBS 621.78]|uniref:Glycosylphosphatidylinositol anchor biosynthesis protein 11 n=1 Tax=Aspergillus brunneoviolaceus CBS 621.78 TaxID=1450534 RepID=A0ACD1FWB2_9EURO|nr:glycosylphosphatidylinositol anchor biosynthesis protein 11 [Aspergillus brunneoviolaceus CBS 621.78]RAH41234.1 glycosylphosphatidylinositol anchor biosynthesis protein 11 [Aspergillus brunneoviolaceus CBS 621.78]
MVSSPPSPTTTGAMSAIHGNNNNSSNSSSSNSGGGPPPILKSSPPVRILPSQLARIYSFAHPAAVLLGFAVRFPQLVNDPVSEMLNALPFLAASQVVFAIICLPPAGGSLDNTLGNSSSGATPSGTSSSSSNIILRPGRPARRKGGGGGSGGAGAGVGGGVLGGLGGKVIPSLLALILTALLATPVLAILLVLFGAPFTTHHAQTALCAAHMALLAAVPLVYVHGVDGAVWREVWGAGRPADAVWGAALGTCVGAWLGAVPIPLDWDRPWQAFPITILAGAYLGFAAGTLLGRTKWVYGKRLRFAEEGELADKKRE